MSPHSRRRSGVTINGGPQRPRRRLRDRRPTERIVGPPAGGAVLVAALELGVPPVLAAIAALVALVAPEVVSRTVDAIEQRREARESGS